jgi:hypothetical protein
VDNIRKLARARGWMLGTDKLPMPSALAAKAAAQAQ